MSLLEPYFLQQTTKYMEKGYLLQDILNDYKGVNGEFNDEIIVSYYHLNNGPDLRDYQKETLEDAIRSFKTHNNYKLLWCCGLGKTKMAFNSLS